MLEAMRMHYSIVLTPDRRIPCRSFWLLCAVLCSTGPRAGAYTPSHGDSFLYLGDSGHAYLENAEVTDFDYTRSLSVEIAARIEPHQIGARWGTFIEKGGDLVLRQASSPGYGLGVVEGNTGSFAKGVSAKIGDGTRQLLVESPVQYEGYVYLIMTWDIGSRTMALFVNGELVGTETDASISPSDFRNDGALRIGAGEHGDTRRNVFLARLWNRLLSPSEVKYLWTEFEGSSRHVLPPVFDRSALVSEWLMDRAEVPGGNAGPPRIMDSAGSNHLKLAGKTELVLAEGPLTAVYPADGASDVDKSVVLRVSGGGSALWGPLVRPLQYWFEIDESPAFNSAGRRQSGWMAHYAEWKPILRPDTEYFWRVKVRDSGVQPKESSFSRTYRFRTRGVSTWYVRPLVDLDDETDEFGNPMADRGVYGKQDGTSYRDAFNGIADIRWGEQGVEAGDTLYVCGAHVYHARADYWTWPVTGYIRESGYSREFPITITMDGPQGRGMLTGIFREVPSSVTWLGPDQNGVYRTNDLPYGAAAVFDGARYVWLDRREAPTWADGDGPAVYNRPREQESWLVETTYLKLPDGQPPHEEIYSADRGFRFDLGRSRYLRFSRCRFFNAALRMNSNRDTVTPTPPATNVVFEECDLGYEYETLLDLSEGMDDWIIRDCNVHHAGKGIHTGTPGYVYRLLVERCAIHDIGAPGFPNGDAHAIGIQNGEDHVIQNNHIWKTAGSAIEFWSSKYTMRNMTVRYNFIHDTTGLAETSASGIVISGGSETGPGKRTGFRIHHNVIMNTAGGDESWRGFGIASNNIDAVEIYNNVLYNTYHGIRLVTSTGAHDYPVKARVYNNMIIRPKGYYAFVTGSDEPWTELRWDYNLYYPATDTASDFYFGQQVARDAHSVLDAPSFVAEPPQNANDFQLGADSPAIDAGTSAGLSRDYAGWVIPWGSAPDIGAFEYHGYP